MIIAFFKAKKIVVSERVVIHSYLRCDIESFLITGFECLYMMSLLENMISQKVECWQNVVLAV